MASYSRHISSKVPGASLPPLPDGTTAPFGSVHVGMSMLSPMIADALFRGGVETGLAHERAAHIGQRSCIAHTRIRAAMKVGLFLFGAMRRRRGGSAILARCPDALIGITIDG
jgi:hypothetical protein